VYRSWKRATVSRGDACWMNVGEDGDVGGVGGIRYGEHNNSSLVACVHVLALPGDAVYFITGINEY